MKTLNTYDLERIARELVKKSGGDITKIGDEFEEIVEKYCLTGDQIYDLSYMFSEIADGFPV